jgi:BspA type Leucine rich repeat region (6 copies)
MKRQTALVGFVGLFSFCNCARALSKTLALPLRTASAPLILPLLLLLTLPAMVQAQLDYTAENGQIAIWGYTGFAGAVVIPDTMYGLPVTSIGDYAFRDCGSLSSITIGTNVSSIGNWAFLHCTSLTSVTIPDCVTNIGEGAFKFCTSLTKITVPSGVTSIGAWAFGSCTSLAGVYFEGNAPIPDSAAFAGAFNPIVYYLPGTTGWNSTFGGRIALLWNSQVQTSGASFGVRTNRFGFAIIGTSGLIVVVEVCTNPNNPLWSPVGTNTLTGGLSYFSDSQWTNYTRRFYRIRSP